MSWICPSCERELKNAHQWHNCVKVSIDSLFENKDPGLVFIFDHILSEISQWQGVIISTTQHCIVFVHRQTFLIIRPMKKQLDIKFYTATPVTHPLVQKSEKYAGRYQNHVRLSASDEVSSALFSFLRQSYLLL